jgi:hypothetical protein
MCQLLDDRMKYVTGLLFAVLSLHAWHCQDGC